MFFTFSTPQKFQLRPRQDSNLCTRLRKPMLYPLSYGGRLNTLIYYTLQPTQKIFTNIVEKSATIYFK